MFLLALILIIMIAGSLAVSYLLLRMNGSVIEYHSFILFGVFITLGSIILYGLSGHWFELNNWLDRGKHHYQLLETLDRLGGVDGAIEKIQQKLSEKPDDAKAREILAKLYWIKQEKTGGHTV